MRRFDGVVAMLLGTLALPSFGGPAQLVSLDPLAAAAPAAIQVVEPADGRAPAEKITPGLWRRLPDGGMVKVLVLLRSPWEATTAAPVKGDTASTDAALAQGVAALAHEFTGRARMLGLVPLRAMSHLPVVVAEAPAERIPDIAADSLVLAIEEDITLYAARTEGGALMRANLLRSQGGGGSGIGVAVLDSGIDYTHAELPAGTKVTAEQDFTGTTGNGRDDQGHGTAVAGIIAGSTGGMAPQAHLWAMKVLKADGKGDLSFMVDALNAVYANRNNFGGVRVVNISIQASHSLETCDNEMPSMTTAMAQLVQAGIAVIVASGNQGCSNGLSFPSCISHAIAVGAVYDANLGTRSYGEGGCMPSGCTDSTTAPDKITCYSNSGNRLDVLAPADCSYTPAMGGGYNSCFNGTSAAAPYTAGVAAQILSLRPATTPAELKAALLATGKSITDPRNGVTRRRVDAVDAYQALLGGGGDTPLTNGVPVTGLASSQNSTFKFFYIDLPSGASNFTVQTSGGTGDPDLYVRRSEKPTTGTYDCRSWNTGTSESCSFPTPQIGRWWIGIYPYEAYSGVTLTASYSGGSSCSYGISPTSRTHGSGVETGSVTVTTTAGCTWTAVSNAAWISVTGGASGSGSGTVNYSVQANGSTSQRTGTVTIAGTTFTVTQSGSGAPPPAGQSTWVEAVIHLDTAGGDRWRSDVGVLNAGTAAATIYFKVYLDSGGTVQGNSNLPVGAGGQALFVDLLGQLGRSDKGSLEVWAAQPLIVTSRTYNEVGAGTYGQFYDGYRSTAGLSAGQMAHIPQLRQDANFRTNISVTNTGATDASVTLTLHTANGTQVWSNTRTVAPGRFYQWVRPFATQGGQTNSKSSPWPVLRLGGGAAILAG